MAVSQPTPSTLAQNTSALDKLLADVKSRIGIFLQNEKVLYDANTRIDALLGAPSLPAQIKTNAQALKAKGAALLKIQTDAEQAAQSMAGRAGDLKTQMETNPIYSFLKTSPTYWGLRQYELIGTLITSTLSLLAEGAGVTARLVKQNADVKSFTNEIQSTENAAAGTGALPAISGLITSTLGTTVSSLSGLVWPIAIAAAAGLALWAGASGGLFRSRR